MDSRRFHAPGSAVCLTALLFWLGAALAASIADTQPADIQALRADYSTTTEALRDRAQVLIRHSASPSRTAWAKLALAELENELENDAAAITLTTQLQAQAIALGLPDLQFAAATLGNIIHVNRGRLAEAEAALATMQKLADAAQRRDWFAQIAHDRGVLERKRGRFDLATKHFESAAALQRQLPGSPRLAHELNSIGMLQGRTGKFSDAAVIHKEALELARADHDKPEVARSLRLLGILYRNLDDEEQGSQYLREALDFIETRNRREQIAVDGELTHSLILLDRLDEAGLHAERNVKLAAATGNPPNKVSAYTRMAEYQLARGVLTRANEWADRAFLEFGKVALRDQVTLRLTRVRMRAAQKANPDILLEARSTLEATQKLGDRILERAALDVVADLEFALGDAQSAYVTRKAHQKLDKELAMDMAGRRIAVLEASLTKERADTEHQTLEQNNQIKDLRILRQRYLGLALLAGMLLLLTVLALLGWRVRAMRRINSALETNRDQLSDLHLALLASNDQLEHIAKTDALTGLCNRRAVIDCIDAAMQHARTQSETSSLLLFDLDHFKQVNDRYGHQAGDAVLREVAKRMRSCLPATATLGRWGGEEFMVIIEACGQTAAIRYAEALRQSLAAEPLIWANDSIQIRASIGVSIFDPQHPTSSNEWIGAADAALYRAKREGRDRVVAAAPAER